MPLTDAGRRKFNRCVEEMRRGNVASRDVADDLLARLTANGITVAEQEEEPDLEAMAAALQAAGYQVVPPDA